MSDLAPVSTARSFMQLNTFIARQIVNRAMKIIHYSINVMDERGCIVGSGDPSRLNQRHEGAVLAITDNRVVEIDGLTAHQLKGVKPGINLPINYLNQVIGVVGISGDPGKVRCYAELVKMTAELVIEQEALMDQIQWNKRHREELVQQLISGPELNDAQLLDIAERLHIDLEQPRIAVIVKLLPKHGETLDLEHLQQLVHLLEYPERDNLVGITSVSRHEVVVLKPIRLHHDGWSAQHERRRVDQLVRRVTKEAPFTIRIALGDYFPGLAGLTQSFLSARATLDTGHDCDTVMFYQDNVLPVLVHGLQQDGWRWQQLLEPIKQLQRVDPKGLLVKTATVFFAHNCDMAQTCKALHIHRNTLRYRLTNIEEKIAIDFNNINDKTRFYLALLAARK